MRAKKTRGPVIREATIGPMCRTGPSVCDCLKVRVVLVALLLSGSASSSAQNVTTVITVQNNNTNLIFDYSLASTNGVFFLVQGSQLTNLFATGEVVASGIAAQEAVGNISVPVPTSSPMFYGLMQDPSLNATPSDLMPNLDGQEADDNRAQTFIEAPSLPMQLPPNVTFLLILHINDINGEIISTNGQLTLSLVLTDGTPAAFPYTMMPPAVTISNGAARTGLTIQTTSNLTGVFLAGSFVGQHPVLVVESTLPSSGTITLESVPYSSYADPDTTSWLYPLSAEVPLIGGFGEYPGHADIHWGIDLQSPAGAPVLASKKGVVVRIGKLCGVEQIVEIFHGNGYVTRYMHINPLVKRGRVVNKGDVIGKVGQFACVPVHLHFEMDELIGPAFYNQGYNYKKLYPGMKVVPNLPISPFSPDFAFSQPLFSSGGYIPVLKLPALYFRSSHPALNLNAALMQPSDPSREPLSSSAAPKTVYVVLQAVLDNAGYRLTPDRITFTPDIGPPQQIIYGTTYQTVKRLDPRGITSSTALAGPGYSLLPSIETTDGFYPDRRYKYWFQWDTSLYAPQVGPPSLGPHRITIHADDIAADAIDKTFTFGPRILNDGQPFVAASEGSLLRVPISFRFGPLPNVGLSGTPLDKCRCAVSVTPASDWTVQLQPDSGNATGFDVTQDDQTNLVTLRVTPNGCQPSPGILSITAESTVFPGIRDQASISLQPPVGIAGLYDGVVNLSEATNQASRLYPGAYFFCQFTLSQTGSDVRMSSALIPWYDPSQPFIGGAGQGPANWNGSNVCAQLDLVGSQDDSFTLSATDAGTVLRGTISSHGKTATFVADRSPPDGFWSGAENMITNISTVSSWIEPTDRTIHLRMPDGSAGKGLVQVVNVIDNIFLTGYGRGKYSFINSDTNIATLVSLGNVPVETVVVVPLEPGSATITVVQGDTVFYRTTFTVVP